MTGHFPMITAHVRHVRGSYSRTLMIWGHLSPLVPLCVSHSVEKACCTFSTKQFTTRQAARSAGRQHKTRSTGHGCTWFANTRMLLNSVSLLERHASVHTGPWLIRGKPGHSLHPCSGNQKATGRCGCYVCGQHKDDSIWTSMPEPQGRPASIWNDDFQLPGSHGPAFFSSDVCVFSLKVN